MGRKSSVESRYQTAKRLLGAHTGTSKGKPGVSIKGKLRPTGGLKPNGLKGEIKITW